MKQELEDRVVQALTDAQELLDHWKQVSFCADCKRLEDETKPFLAGLRQLLSEVKAVG